MEVGPSDFGDSLLKGAYSWVVLPPRPYSSELLVYRSAIYPQWKTFKYGLGGRLPESLAGLSDLQSNLPPMTTLVGHVLLSPGLKTLHLIVSRYNRPLSQPTSLRTKGSLSDMIIPQRKLLVSCTDPLSPTGLFIPSKSQKCNRSGVGNASSK